jgi:hypothetical protein
MADRRLSCGGARGVDDHATEALEQALVRKLLVDCAPQYKPYAPPFLAKSVVTASARGREAPLVSTPAESQIPVTNNHPLTMKAASWRVLIANQ